MRLPFRSIFAVGLTALIVLGPTVPATGATPPPKLVGLDVAKEDLGKSLGKTSRPELLTSVDLYSLRKAGKELEATIQIGTFRKGAPTTSRRFQRTIAQKVGTAVPREQRVGGTVVYVTKAKKLDIAVWFRNRNMFILSIREGFDQPKALIRQSVGIQ